VNTPSTPPPEADAGFIYDVDDYFAFVEANEPLRRSSSRNDATERAIDSILRERAGRGLPRPARALWLDCVQSQYFMRLPWRDEICQIGNLEDSDRRRSQLLALDRRHFRAALLLIEPKGAAEIGMFGEFKRASWHRIVLSTQSGIPTLTGADFDLELDTQQTRHLRYLGVCSEFERKALTNVFSFDFLPDANISERERGDPNSPPKSRPPKNRTGAAKDLSEPPKKQITYEDPLQQRYQYMV